MRIPASTPFVTICDLHWHRRDSCSGVSLLVPGKTGWRVQDTRAPPQLDVCERQQSSQGAMIAGALLGGSEGGGAAGGQGQDLEGLEDLEGNDAGPGKSLLKKEDLVSISLIKTW